jgi:hypothetical protein
MKLSPFTLDEAREAARLASAQQAGAEGQLRENSKALAEAERSYRVALAQERLRLHAQDGVAWTATDDIARGVKHVADLRYARDVAKGVYEAASAALWRFTADRRDVGRFIDWSARRDLAEGYGRDPDHDWSKEPVIGSRRNAA